jgi:hypothetical protein
LGLRVEGEERIEFIIIIIIGNATVLREPVGNLL